MLRSSTKGPPPGVNIKSKRKMVAGHMDRYALLKQVNVLQREEAEDQAVGAEAAKEKRMQERKERSEARQMQWEEDRWVIGDGDNNNANDISKC
jgi:hypothetical protein